MLVQFKDFFAAENRTAIKMSLGVETSQLFPRAPEVPATSVRVHCQWRGKFEIILKSDRSDAQFPSFSY